VSTEASIAHPHRAAAAERTGALASESQPGVTSLEKWGFDVRAWRKPALGAWIAFVLGLLAAWCIPAVIGLGRSDDERDRLEIAIMGLSTVFFAAGCFLSFVSLSRAFPKLRSWRLFGVASALFVPGVVGGFFFLIGALSVLVGTGGGRGRQLRRRGKVLLPPVSSGDAWSGVPMRINLDEVQRDACADRWRENGQTEHASVAAFARLTLNLMALGAPPALIEAAHRDSLDEIRHTKLCFSLARGIDGVEKSPGPFPKAQHAGALPEIRSWALAQLAVDSLVDGALHEGLSARILAKLVRRCEDPKIQEVLRTLAADEGRHAAHGWDVVDWCLAEGGFPVACALRGAIKALPVRASTTLPQEARGGGWERYGIPGAGLEAGEYSRTRAAVVNRATALAEQWGAETGVVPRKGSRGFRLAREFLKTRALPNHGRGSW
jgi:hypothetical protein